VYKRQDLVDSKIITKQRGEELVKMSPFPKLT